jgi:hypothetical protein
MPKRSSTPDACAAQAADCLARYADPERGGCEPLPAGFLDRLRTPPGPDVRVERFVPYAQVLPRQRERDRDRA